jgi:hypothetical protein
MPSAFCIPMP